MKTLSQKILSVIQDEIGCYEDSRQLESGAIAAVHARVMGVLSDVRPLPPEVTPEQGKGAKPTATPEEEELANKIVYRVCNLPFNTYGEANAHVAQLLANARTGYIEPCPPPTFAKPPPASGPSPAAKEVANDIACKLVGGDYSLDEARALCAAIIDRKFPREEAIVHLTAELLRMCAKADGKCRKLVNDPTPDIEASDFQHAVMALEKYGDSQQLALHHGWLSQVKDGLSARAALQDSREGK